MPHFTIEYSANLDGRIDLAEVVEVVAPLIPPVDVPLASDPDRSPPGGALRLGEGRDLATRKRTGEHIFEALSDYLDPVFAQGKFALSFDMQINDKETGWKRNNIHEALKAKAAHG